MKVPDSMEKMNLEALIILALFLLCSCRSDSALTESEKQEIADEVRETLRCYHADINKNGLAAEFKYLDSSSDFFWIPPGYTTAISFDSVAELLNENARRFNSITNSWDTVRITVLTNELASYAGRLHSIASDTSGIISESKLVETGLLIKRRNGWKLLSGQTSLVGMQ